MAATPGDAKPPNTSRRKFRAAASIQKSPLRVLINPVPKSVSLQAYDAAGLRLLTRKGPGTREHVDVIPIRTTRASSCPSTGRPARET